jgi:phosphate-selective porin OprO/OprP
LRTTCTFLTLALVVLPAVGGEIALGHEASRAEHAQSEKKDEADEKKSFDVYWDAGLHLQGSWDDLKIKIGADVQNDTAGYANVDSAEGVIGKPIEPDVEWRRARVYAEGSVHRHVEFKFRYDFAVSNPPNLKDAYASLVNLPIPTLEVTVGRFRAPLGLDGYTRADDLVFLERSTLTTAFLPSRNTGFLFHGDSPRHRIRWSIGALQPEADDLSLKNTDNLGYSGRFAAAFHPGAAKKTLLHLGVDLWRRNVEDTFQLATRPESHIAPSFVDTGEITSEHLSTALFEVGVQRGPLTFQSEFAGTHLKTHDLGTVFFHAFYLQGSYFLTGETRPYRTERGTFSRPKPKREFRESSGGLGAFELGVRFSRIDLDDGAVTGGRLNDWSFAFNWYPSYYIQVMGNFIVANLANAEPVAIFQMRLQVGF